MTDRKSEQTCIFHASRGETCPSHRPIDSHKHTCVPKLNIYTNFIWQGSEFIKSSLNIHFRWMFVTTTNNKRKTIHSINRLLFVRISSFDEGTVFPNILFTIYFFSFSVSRPRKKWIALAFITLPSLRVMDVCMFSARKRGEFSVSTFFFCSPLSHFRICDFAILKEPVFFVATYRVFIWKQ